MDNIVPFRKAHVGIKYEDIISGQLYAFNLNPNDKLQFWHRTNRLEAYKREMDRMIQKCFYTKYYLYTEFSPTGRLHHHGYVYTNQKMETYLNDLNNFTEIGTWVMKKIDDYSYWHQYATKQKLELIISNIDKIQIDMMLDIEIKKENEMIEAAQEKSDKK